MSDEIVSEATDGGPATTLEITAGGKPWKLGRIGFSIRLDAETKVREQRRIEFKSVLESLKDIPDDQKATATLAAFDHLLRNITVSVGEASQWMGTPSGELHQLWKSLQAADEAATIEQARELLGAIDTRQYAQVQDFWGRHIGSHRVVALSNENYAILKDLLKLED